MLIVPHSSEAELPVIDKSNLAENAITSVKTAATAASMIEQVANSSAEVEMMITNLLQSLNQPLYDLGLYEQLLIGMSEAAGPRPTQARNLDYFQPGLQAAMKELYPGYAPMYGMPELQAGNEDIHLNTIESEIGRLGVEAGTESDLRYDIQRFELYERNEKAPGNLAALQIGNAIALFSADGVRRLEKSIAGNTNLMAIKHATDQQKESWGNAATDVGLELAAGDGLPSYDGGAGGVSYFSMRGVNF